MSLGQSPELLSGALSAWTSSPCSNNYTLLLPFSPTHGNGSSLMQTRELRCLVVSPHPEHSFANSPFIKISNCPSLTMSSASCWGPDCYTSFSTEEKEVIALHVSSPHSECPYMLQTSPRPQLCVSEITRGCRTSLCLFSFLLEWE